MDSMLNEAVKITMPYCTLHICGILAVDWWVTRGLRRGPSQSVLGVPNAKSQCTNNHIIMMLYLITYDVRFVSNINKVSPYRDATLLARRRVLSW